MAEPGVATTTGGRTGMSPSWSDAFKVLIFSFSGFVIVAGANKEEPRRVEIHGEKLVGLLHETGSKEIVVLCHGFRSRKENAVMITAANALKAEGITAFRFDFAGNG